MYHKSCTPGKKQCEKMTYKTTHYEINIIQEKETSNTLYGKYIKVKKINRLLPALKKNAKIRRKNSN